MNGVMQFFRIVRAVALRNYDRGAQRKTGAKADQHVNDASDAPDSRKRFLTHKLADNDCIHCIVQLLKD